MAAHPDMLQGELSLAAGCSCIIVLFLGTMPVNAILRRLGKWTTGKGENM